VIAVGRVFVCPDFLSWQLRSGYGDLVSHFYLSPWWLWEKHLKEGGDLTRFPRQLVQVVRRGGVKQAFGIPSRVCYIGGCDRYIFRNPIQTAVENVILGADVVCCQDVSLEEKDTEEKVIEKLAWSRASIDAVSEYLREKYPRIKVLGIAHGYLVEGDPKGSLETYLREAEYIAPMVDWVGVPTAPLTMKKSYEFINQLIREVADTTRKDTIQLMGGQAIPLLPIAAKIAKEKDVTLILEADTIGTYSRRRRVLTYDKGELRFAPVYQMKNVKLDSVKEIFKFNLQAYKDALRSLMDAI